MCFRFDRKHTTNLMVALEVRIFRYAELNGVEDSYGVCTLYQMVPHSVFVIRFM